MELELEGQVGIVAGGARGIGRAIAAAFLAEGAHVAIIDRDERVAEAAGEIEASASSRGARAIGCPADITCVNDLEDARDLVFRTFGGWHHVVVAAAIGSGKFGYPFLRLDLADWRRVLEVNVEGAVAMSHVFVPHLLDTRAGTILYISSVAAQFGSQTDPPYSASKAALLNFAQCVARDAAPHGVRANSICPGMVRTDLNRSVWEAWAALQKPSERISYEEWADEKVKRVVPLGRWQEPEDIADLAVFLASRRAKNITGQTINVDGGYVMR